MTKVKYTKELLQEAVDASISMRGVLTILGLKHAGGSYTHVKRRIDGYGISTEHFTGQGHMKGKPAMRRKTYEEIFVVLPEGSPRPKAKQLRRALLEVGVKEECTECGQGPLWNGKRLQLHVDHVNGNWYNNLRENLRFLCPNCHTQQEETNRPHKNSK